MKSSHALIALLLLVFTAQAAGMNLIQLNNRPAAEIIPVIEPMLRPGDVISGSGFKIFLRSSPETLAEVEVIIAALDAPAEVLQISVFQGGTRDVKKLGIGGSIQISNDHVSGSVSGIASEQSQQNNPVSRVRVNEGREAYIETGKQLPFFSGSDAYNSAVTGFYVLPRVSGSNVILEVSPFKNMLTSSGGDGIETQSANTTISGQMGQWLLIGGVSQQSSYLQSGIASQSSSQSSRDDSIWIKVDLIQ